MNNKTILLLGDNDSMCIFLSAALSIGKKVSEEILFTDTLFHNDANVPLITSYVIQCDNNVKYTFICLLSLNTFPRVIKQKLKSLNIEYVICTVTIPDSNWIKRITYQNAIKIISKPIFYIQYLYREEHYDVSLHFQEKNDIQYCFLERYKSISESLKTLLTMNLNKKYLIPPSETDPQESTDLEINHSGSIRLIPKPIYDTIPEPISHTIPEMIPQTMPETMSELLPNFMSINDDTILQDLNILIQILPHHIDNLEIILKDIYNARVLRLARRINDILYNIHCSKEFIYDINFVGMNMPASKKILLEYFKFIDRRCEITNITDNGFVLNW